MIFDNLQMYADDLAHGGTPSEVDLGAAEQGRGEPLEVSIQGHSLTSAGDITVAFQSSATSGSGHATDQSIVATPAEINAGLKMTVPVAGVKRYTQVTLSGTSGGTWTAGLTPRGHHSNP